MKKSELQERLGQARLMLIFTPSLAADPLAALEAVLPWVDVIQVRAKSPDETIAGARETHEWTERVLDLLAGARHPDALVIVDDRVDVAAVLQPRGVVGVHLGRDDCPVDAARELLGPDACIGSSTHDMRQLARAAEQSIDYAGFGPIFPTTTKGYERGVGPEAAWIAASSTSLPLFPIGGIDGTNANELATVGRAAVASALLAAEDPAGAARALCGALSGETH